MRARDWRWIVICEGLPVRIWSDGRPWLLAHGYADSFGTWQEAYEVRNRLRREYLTVANRADSEESPTFKRWLAKAEAVRVLRVRI